MQVLVRNLSILRRQAGRFWACLYRIDKGFSFPLGFKVNRFIKPVSPISAHPTTSTPMPPPSSLSPLPLKNALKLPRSQMIALSHHLSTSGQPLYTASLAFPFLALQNRRKHGPWTKPRTRKARSYFLANSAKLKYCIRTVLRVKGLLFLSICGSQRMLHLRTLSHVSFRSLVWMDIGPKWRMHRTIISLADGGLLPSRSQGQEIVLLCAMILLLQIACGHRYLTGWTEGKNLTGRGESHGGWARVGIMQWGLRIRTRRDWQRR